MAQGMGLGQKDVKLTRRGGAEGGQAGLCSQEGEGADTTL